MRYEPIPANTEYDIEDGLARGDLKGLRLVALSFALHSRDPKQAEEICLRLARHEDANVRANAILSLGHIARIHHRLTEPKQGSRSKQRSEIAMLGLGGRQSPPQTTSSCIWDGSSIDHECLPPPSTSGGPVHHE